MTAQRAFHILVLGLTLCQLSGVLSTVIESRDNGVVVNQDHSMDSVSFWKQLFKDVLEAPK